MPHAQRAGMLCAAEGFQRFIASEFPISWSEGDGTDAEQAARVLRAKCGVASRSEIVAGGELAPGIEKINSDYLLWRAHEQK